MRATRDRLACPLKGTDSQFLSMTLYCRTPSARKDPREIGAEIRKDPPDGYTAILSHQSVEIQPPGASPDPSNS